MIGDHLRKRRLDLGLLQKEVAVQIGVNTLTITNWEKQRTVPEIQHMPKIIRFLGYCPLGQPKSFSEKLKALRTALGLSQRKLAEKLKIDPGSIARWESGKHQPIGKYQKLILVFMTDQE